MNDTNMIIQLERALALVFDAKSVVLKGLRANPSKEEERRLNKTLALLEVEQTDLVNLIDALEDAPDDMPLPSPALVSSIATLTGRVEGQTTANMTASGALALASDILDMATAATV